MNDLDQIRFEAMNIGDANREQQPVLNLIKIGLDGRCAAADML